jgi:hypothetical protein
MIAATAGCRTRMLGANSGASRHGSGCRGNLKICAILRYRALSSGTVKWRSGSTGGFIEQRPENVANTGSENACHEAAGARHAKKVTFGDIEWGCGNENEGSDRAN